MHTSPQLATLFVRVTHSCSTTFTSSRHVSMTSHCSGFVARCKSTHKQDLRSLFFLHFLLFFLSSASFHAARTAGQAEKAVCCGFGVVWNANEVCSETWDTLSYGPPPEVQPYRSCVKPPPDFSSVPNPTSLNSDCVLP